MKLHGNARTCPNSRRLLLDRVSDQSWSVAAAAHAAGISERTAYRWLRRWKVFIGEFTAETICRK